MSIFIQHTDMTAREIVNTCIQARAIVCLCGRAAWSDLQNGSEAKIPVVAEDIQFALQLVADLLVPVQEALESHEGVETEEPIRMTGGGRNG